MFKTVKKISKLSVQARQASIDAGRLLNHTGTRNEALSSKRMNNMQQVVTS